jgi:hypothetical protein
VVNLDGLSASTSRGGIGQQLCVAALLGADEPEDGLLDGAAGGEQTMVLQQRELLVAQLLCDVLAFLLGEDDAIELVVDDVVLWWFVST